MRSIPTAAAPASPRSAAASAGPRPRAPPHPRATPSAAAASAREPLPQPLRALANQVLRPDGVHQSPSQSINSTSRDRRRLVLRHHERGTLTAPPPALARSSHRSDPRREFHLGVAVVVFAARSTAPSAPIAAESIRPPKLRLVRANLREYLLQKRPLGHRFEHHVQLRARAHRLRRRHLANDLHVVVVTAGRRRIRRAGRVFPSFFRRTTPFRLFEDGARRRCRARRTRGPPRRAASRDIAGT